MHRNKGTVPSRKNTSVSTPGSWLPQRGGDFATGPEAVALAVTNRLFAMASIRTWRCDPIGSCCPKKESKAAMPRRTPKRPLSFDSLRGWPKLQPKKTNESALAILECGEASPLWILFLDSHLR